MIGTLAIKRQMPVFTTGNLGATAKDVVLIVGSCRCVPYLNYVLRHNEMSGEPFRIHFIEPWDNHWNAAGEMVDFEAALLALEQNERVLSVLRETTIYIHEFYNSAGMFNSSRDSEKNIYQFGLVPRIECSIPNFHDHFALAQEQLQWDEAKRNQYKQTGMTPRLLDLMKEDGLASLERFYSACAKSDLPEFAAIFRFNWRRQRMFWTGNHVASNFTLRMFDLINTKFLNWPLSEEFWAAASTEDLYKEPHTPMTRWDQQMYGLTWPEELGELRAP